MSALIEYVEWSWPKYLHDYYIGLACAQLMHNDMVNVQPPLSPILYTTPIRWCNYIGERLFKSVTFTVTYVPQYQREVSKMIRMIAAVSPGSSLERFMRNRIYDRHLMGIILEFVSEYEPPAGAVPIDFWHQDMWEA